MLELLAIWLLIGFAGAYIQGAMQGEPLRNPITVAFDFLAVSLIMAVFIILWPLVVLISFFACYGEQVK